MPTEYQVHKKFKELIKNSSLNIDSTIYDLLIVLNDLTLKIIDNDTKFELIYLDAHRELKKKKSYLILK